MLQKQLSIYRYVRGQFQPETGGQFEMETGGQLPPDLGGQFERIFHYTILLIIVL
jgi:hypothetical protein